MNFLQVLEERRPEWLIDQVFVGCKSRSLMLCKVFYYLPVELISFELKGVSELFQGWVVITVMPHLTDFFRETPKGFFRFVLEILMNGSCFQAIAEVPPQQQHVQQGLFAHMTPKSFRVPRIVFGLVLSWYSLMCLGIASFFFWNSVYNEQGAEFTEPFLWVIMNMNVDL